MHERGRSLHLPGLKPELPRSAEASAVAEKSSRRVGIDDPRYPAFFRQVAMDRLREGLRWSPAISQRSPFRIAVNVSLNQPLDSSNTVDSERHSSSAQDLTSSRTS